MFLYILIYTEIKHPRRGIYEDDQQIDRLASWVTPDNRDPAYLPQLKSGRGGGQMRPGD
jgi:hypothetical protein